MHAQSLDISQLHVSPLNMRAEKKSPSLKRMAAIAANLLPTIREQGILTPLIVRPNNDGFEILAGRRRFYAAKVVEQERGGFSEIHCDVREGLTDAEAVEISLTENLAREDADELTYYEAFLSLTLKGRTVDEIARTYGKTERDVQQYLAIANLLPAIRELYRGEHLDTGDLRLLTMATKTQQREWLKLWPEDEAPTGTDLKGWLFGGAAIRTKFALFDLAPFAKKITGDLFSEDSFFTDATAFWEAQDEAIAARRDQYLAAKWSEVVVLERGRQWPQWEFVKASKKDGGRVYLDLHRHAAVQLALIARPSEAMRLLIAHAIAASGNWRVSPDPRRADSKAAAESVAASPAQALFEAEQKAVRKLLAPAFKDREDDDQVSSHAHGDGDLTWSVFQRLLKLKDHEVGRIGAFVMAETLASGSDVTDAFGTHAKVEARAHWTPDATFFDLLRDRATVNHLLAEVAGQRIADKQVSAKMKDQKAALATATASKEDWCPSWMRFPAAEL